MTSSQHSDIKEYYGKVLQGSHDLKTNACCITDSLPPHIRRIVETIAPEVRDRFYGCGSPIPPALEGCTVLDLGCGTGRDAFICANLVGPTGTVIGVDMTDEQIAVARSVEADQANRFGYDKPNTAFRQGYLEALNDADIADESIDIVISNCVINLSPKKHDVFREIFRVLKPGGELLFSDIFVDRRLDEALAEDQVLVGECLAGALYFEDFRRLLLQVGCPDYRIVSQREVVIDDPSVREKVGPAAFISATVRAFKLPNLEDRCEDYGQVATYRGTILFSPNSFALDDHHNFIVHKPMLVCGNTAAMVQDTRLAKHFDVTGDRTRHFGLFPCGPEPSNIVTDKETALPNCC